MPSGNWLQLICKTKLFKTFSPVQLNTLRTRQNGRHFADWHSQMHFLEWKRLNSDWNVSDVCSKAPLNNIPTLVWIMAWCRPGDMPLSEPMMVSLRRIYASLGPSELNFITCTGIHLTVQYSLEYNLQIYWNGVYYHYIEHNKTYVLKYIACIVNTFSVTQTLLM